VWEKAAYYLVLKVKMFLCMLLYFAVFRLYWGMQDSINLALVNTTNYWYQAGTSQPVCGSPEELCNSGCILIKTSVGCHFHSYNVILYIHKQRKVKCVTPSGGD
jgi:hypothetical protein